MAELRPVTPNDYSAVATLSRAALAQALVGRPTWQSPADVAADMAAAGSGAFLVAVDEAGDVTGVAGYRLTERGEAELFGPLVSATGRGTGAWLGNRVEDMAFRDGAAVCSMLIGLDNRPGATWAEWRGYQCDTEYPETVLMWAYPSELTAPADPTLQIRSALPTDADRIKEICQDCFVSPPFLQNESGSWLPSLQVVIADGQVHAFADFSPDLARLTFVCVDPARQRRGIGTALVGTLLRRYWETCQRRVELAVSAEAGATAFFRSLGFGHAVPVTKWIKRP